MTPSQAERLGDWYSSGESLAADAAEKSLRRWTLKQTTAGKFSENPFSSELPFGFKNRLALEVAGLGRIFLISDHDPRELQLLDLLKVSGELNVSSVLPQIVFGALRLDLGQGLLYSTEKDFLIDPFSQARSVLRQSGIRPDSGFREIHPFGIGSQFLVPGFRMLGFVGKIGYDAKISSATSFGEWATVPNFTDLDLPHTNVALVEARQALTEWTGCIGLEWFGEHYRISINGVASRFSLPLGDLEHGEKLLRSKGGCSATFQFGDEKIKFFGEGALQFENPFETASPLVISSTNPSFAFRGGFIGISSDGENRKDRTESFIRMRLFSPTFDPTHTRLEEGTSSGRDELGLTVGLARKWENGDRLGLAFDACSALSPFLSRISETDQRIKTRADIATEIKIWKKIRYEGSFSSDLDSPKDQVFRARLRNGVVFSHSNLMLRTSLLVAKDFLPQPTDFVFPWLWENEGRLIFSMWECGLKASVFDTGKGFGFSRFESGSPLDVAPVYLQGRGLRLSSRFGLHATRAWQLGLANSFDFREGADIRFSVSMFFQTEWGG